MGMEDHDKLSEPSLDPYEDSSSLTWAFLQWDFCSPLRSLMWLVANHMCTIEKSKSPFTHPRVYIPAEDS